MKPEGNKALNFIKMLGPGLLFAGAAIGVSHLVQSTRAGATFGFGLIWAVVLANVLKYPFFEFGPRYTGATGESLLMGYKKLGKWVLLLFLAITLLTVFTIQAAVTSVTAAILQNLFPIGQSSIAWSAIVLLFCLLLLAIGKYSLLDSLMKVIIVSLAISTLIAVFAALWSHSRSPTFAIGFFDWKSALNISFLIGLMGWMPAPIDLSVWNSLWALEKKKLNKNFQARESLLDFNVGYWGAAILALFFVALGAFVMFGSGESLSDKGAVFAGQLIELYTKSIGNRAFWIIVIAAFTTMFSTTLTCFDAIPRVFAKTTILLKCNSPKIELEKKLYWLFIVLLMLGALSLIHFFSGQMIRLVQLATILSFLTAPFFAVANYKLVTGKNIPIEFQPKKWLIVLSWLGISFLIGFSLFYIYSEISKPVTAT